MELGAAADLLTACNTALLAANAARIHKAQELMQRFGAQGVPTLIVSDDNGVRLLRGSVLYDSFDSLLSHIAAA